MQKRPNERRLASPSLDHPLARGSPLPPLPLLDTTPRPSRLSPMATMTRTTRRKRSQLPNAVAPLDPPGDPTALALAQPLATFPHLSPTLSFQPQQTPSSTVSTSENSSSGSASSPRPSVLD